MVGDEEVLCSRSFAVAVSPTFQHSVAGFAGLRYDPFWFCYTDIDAYQPGARSRLYLVAAQFLSCALCQKPSLTAAVSDV